MQGLRAGRSRERPPRSTDAVGGFDQARNVGAVQHVAAQDVASNEQHDAGFTLKYPSGAMNARKPETLARGASGLG